MVEVVHPEVARKSNTSREYDIDKRPRHPDLEQILGKIPKYRIDSRVFRTTVRPPTHRKAAGQRVLVIHDQVGVSKFRGTAITGLESSQSQQNAPSIHGLVSCQLCD